MKFLLRVLAAVVVFTSAGAGYALETITFIGPRETYLDTVKPFAVQDPGSFDVFNFTGSGLNDVAVPTFRNYVQGLNNLDNWGDPTPNGYFTHQYVDNTDLFISAHQVLKGNFDGNATPDLLIVTAGNLAICYDYNGLCPGGFSNKIEVKVLTDAGAPAPVRNFFATVTDFTGEGKDDVAVVSWAEKKTGEWTGYLTVFQGSGAGGGDPLGSATPYYGPFEIPNGLPFSITHADTDGDGKKDIATGQIQKPICKSAVGAFLYVFRNTGASFSPNASEIFKVNECVLPSGLIATDPDADGKSDLVATCYFKGNPGGAVPVEAVAALEPNTCGQLVAGPVYLLKNKGDAVNFTREQTLTGLDYPATTTAADYNKDGFQDLAVAEHQGQNVVVYAGKAPFEVLEPGNKISTNGYNPFFIQSHHMNNDDFYDIVLTALNFDFVRLFHPPRTDVVQIDSQISVLTDNATLDSTTVFYSADSTAWANALLNNPLSIQERTYRFQDGNHFYTFTPNAIDGQTVSTNLYLFNQQLDSVPTYYRTVPTLDSVRSGEGVLVLINDHSEVSIDDPDCDRREVAYRCLAPEGRKITECKAMSVDAGVVITPAASISSDDREWKGMIQLPAENKVYKVTVTAVDDAPKTVSGEMTIDLSHCPGEGACPVEPKRIQNWAWYPVSFCPDIDSGGKGFDFGITSGPAQIGFGDSSKLGILSSNGDCLSGTLGPQDDKPNYTEKVIVEAWYQIKGSNQKCQVIFEGLPIELRGTGRFCSLGSVGPLSFGDFSGLFSTLFAGWIGLGVWRLRSKR